MLTVLILLVLAAALAACGGEVASPSTAVAEARSQPVDPRPGTAASALSTSYRNALPIETQLAFGTLQLEDTELAVTPEQAETLVPYWRVLQGLTANGSAAQAEIDAVARQIAGGMTPEQIAAIAALQLTEEKLQTMLDQGTLAIRFGPGLGSGEERDRIQGPGGGLGGGFAGGGPGGGPGALGGDPDALATRQAEAEASGDSPLTRMINTTSSNLVIRLLETKLGTAPAQSFGGLGPALTAVSELAGLSVEEIDAALAAGQTLAQVLEENDISPEEARAALAEALADLSRSQDQDLDTWIDALLSGARDVGQPVPQSE